MKTEERERDFREMRAFSQVLVKHRTRYSLFEAFLCILRGKSAYNFLHFLRANTHTREQQRRQ
jgi:hypothetical protein